MLHSLKISNDEMRDYVKKRFHIPTGCLELDRLLEGGIQSFKVTEIYGASGSGKTQLSIELMLNTLFSNTNGSVIYISTKNCLTPENIKTKINRFVDVRNKAVSSLKDRVTIHQYLQRICFKRAYTLCDMIFAIHHARECVDQFFHQPHPIKLIIVDSFTYFLRDQTYLERRRIAYELVRILENTATKFNSAVVITTDMSPDIKAKTNMPVLKPMLDVSFFLRPSIRIELNKNPISNIIYAVIRKKLFLTKIGTMASFKIDDVRGITDLQEMK